MGESIRLLPCEQIWCEDMECNAVPQHFHCSEFNSSHLHLSETMECWLVETRCIPQKAIEALRMGEDMQLMPQSGENENCLCFNYFENGELVNVKYWSGKKTFQDGDRIRIDFLQHRRHLVHPGMHRY